MTVCDHRPALLDAARFPHCRLRCQPPQEFRHLPDVADCDAAIVMSHHLDADLAYLEALADRGTIGYVGLLGPAPRRDRLLAVARRARRAASKAGCARRSGSTSARARRRRSRSRRPASCTPGSPAAAAAPFTRASRTTPA